MAKSKFTSKKSNTIFSEKMSRQSSTNSRISSQGRRFDEASSYQDSSGVFKTGAFKRSDSRGMSVGS